nr:reverse transcriptase domain-containing protein [Tanacetum cinerariifolium]
MHTRFKSYPNNSNATIHRRSNRRHVPNIVEPEIRTIEEVVPMADRTIEEQLQASTEGYREAIVIPEILAKNFKIKTNLLQLVQTNKFHGFERDNPHTHISNFKRMTSTLKYRDVPNDAIKLMLFPYSLEGAARIWDSSSKTDDRIDKLADQILNLVEIVNKQVITPATAKAVEKTCVICGGAQAYYDYIATDSNQPSVCAATGTYNQVSLPNRASNQIPPPGFAPASTSGTLLSNTVPNPKGEMKAVTTRSGLDYEGPSILTNSPLEKVVERDTEETMDKEHSNCQGSTAQVQPLVVPISIPEPDVPKTQPKPNIPYPSRLNDQKLREKATNQMENLLTNKDKLFELAKVPMNENCSAMLLKKLLKKLGDPGKFLIPCNFLGIDVCHALADLGASINLMPLSIWKKLFLPELTPTQMTLELAARSITRPKGVAEDVFVKVGKFHFFTDFVVVDFEADPRVPLILGRSFLRTGRALIDVYGEEITLRVNDESYNSKSSNPTLVSNASFSKETKSEFCKEPIVKSSSPTITPFGEKETKAKSSIEEPPELELKELPSHLEYVFLEDSDKLPGIDPRFCTHKILMEEDYKLAVQSQRRVNPKIHDVIKKEVIKLFDAGMIYPISDSPWVSPIHCVPKKGGMTVVANENNELIPTRLVTGWRVCIDYRKLNDATRKDHFTLPFMDQMLERLAGNKFYCFLDGFLGYFQIPIDPQDQEKTTFTCPYETFAYRRMPFGLCNAPSTFQRCMIASFHDMIEKTMEVFMDDFSEKCHFMCKEGIVLGHKILKSKFEVDRAKVDVIAKLPHSTTVKGVRIFLGHAGFYRHFIQDFSKIARPMTHLLEKETSFVFSKECVDAFDTLKEKLTEAPILVVPDWNLPFELMCDASDFAIGAVLGQRKTKHFQPIHYASKTMTEAQIHYTTTEKEMLAVVYAFEKFRPYLVLSKSIVYTDHSTLKYLLSKQDAKPRLLWWVLLLQEFDITIRDKKGYENLAADHLSRLENPHKDVLKNKDINENFPLETLGILSSGKAIDILKACHEGPTGSHHGANLTAKKFARVMTKYGVTHRLATAYHPQASGQVKVSNRGLKRILERTFGENRASWSDKLDDALWAFRTAFKTPIGCTPYKLVYRKSCHLPIELGHKAYWALKHVKFDLKTAGDHQKLQLNELNELRDQAYENSLIYKERTKKLHDSKIKNRIFNAGDQVLLFNSRLKIFSGKLKTRWSGPFTITQVFSYGIVELSQSNSPNFKVNGHRVKHYFGGDIPSKVVPDLHTILMDK